MSKIYNKTNENVPFFRKNLISRKFGIIFDCDDPNFSYATYLPTPNKQLPLATSLSI